MTANLCWLGAVTPVTVRWGAYWLGCWCAARQARCFDCELCSGSARRSRTKGLKGITESESEGQWSGTAVRNIRNRKWSMLKPNMKKNLGVFLLEKKKKVTKNLPNSNSWHSNNHRTKWSLRLNFFWKGGGGGGQQLIHIPNRTGAAPARPPSLFLAPPLSIHYKIYDLIYRGL